MEEKERMTEQYMVMNKLHSLEVGGGIADTNKSYEANFTITYTTEAAKKDKNRRRRHNKKFMQNLQASGTGGSCKSRAKATFNRNNAVATPDSKRRIEF